MVLGCSSTPLHKRLGPGWAQNEMMARPATLAECLIRARSSECRCIHSRCRSIRMSFAVKRPRPVTVSSALVARVDAAYSSGSEKLCTVLNGISTSPRASTMHVLEGATLALLVDLRQGCHNKFTAGPLIVHDSDKHTRPGPCRAAPHSTGAASAPRCRAPRRFGQCPERVDAVPDPRTERGCLDAD